MRHIVRILALGAVWGTLAGTAISALNVATNRYLQHGLNRLALDLLAHSAWTYLVAGLIGGVFAAVIHLIITPVGRRLHPRPAGALAAVGGLAMFVAGAFPVWLWTVPHDFWLYQRSRTLMLIVFIVLAVLHILAYAIIVHRLMRTEFLRRRSRPIFITAGACGLFLIALTAGNLAARPSPASLAGRPNVLIILLDTVRADRLSCYGYDRPTTPVIDAVAAEGILYPNFYATSPWTVPSHASLFTGLYAVRHGATQEHLKLANRFTTMAEALADAGYRTWGASGNPFISWTTNMIQGFRVEDFVDTWRPVMKRYFEGGGIHTNNAAFARFLEGADRERPFFAFINYMDAHTPYRPPEPYLSRFLRADIEPEAALKIGGRRWTNFYIHGPYPREELDILSDLYDGEIAHVDHLVGDLLEILRRDGRYENTVIVITSDHGEHLGENGLLEHVFGLYNTTVRVPLIVRLPDNMRAGETDERQGQLVDLYPTVLNLCGVDPSAFEHDGIDLLDADHPDGREGILSEYYYPVQVLGSFDRKELDDHIEKLTPYLRRLRAYQRDGHRVIWSSDGRHALYDLATDPGESRNLFDRDDPPETFVTLMDHLDDAVDRFARGAVIPPEPDLATALPGIDRTADPETIEALRGLGYVK